MLSQDGGGKGECYICRVGSAPFPDSWTSAVRVVEGRYRLRVWVSAGSSRNRVDGIHGEALKVRVTPPPEGGKANRAVEELLSTEVGGRARVVSGRKSRHKEVEITL
ncbi:MAG: DUF167 domain-containing protein [bacterium]|nr:DUF167 domain-containing protein [bacterium]MDE0234302.1 DUF167 domain-containing protein [bacterium]